MKKKLLAICLMFCSFAGALAQNRVAILDFNRKGDAMKAEVEAINAIFTTYFSPAGFVLVERDQLDKIRREQGLQQTSFTEKDMVKLGKVLNVRYIVVGDVTVVTGRTNIDLRVLDVQTGAIVSKGGKEWNKGASYRESINDLATTLSRGLETYAKTAPAVADPFDDKQPVVLYDHLVVYPEDLGRFTSYPETIINQINSKKMYDYDDWRLPTEEELEMMNNNKADLYITESIRDYWYTFNNGKKQDRYYIRLVTTVKKPVKEQPKPRIQLPPARDWSVEENANTLMQKARSGDREAQYKISQYYKNGLWGMPKNPDKANVWRKRAADNGYARAIDEVYTGNKKYRLLKKLAQKDNDDAIYFISCMRYQFAGTNYKYNAPWRKKYIDKCVSQYNRCNPESLKDKVSSVDYSIQEALRKAPFEERHKSQCFESSHSYAADCNHFPSMAIIGYFYYKGIGCQQDVHKALEWSYKAAYGLNTEAMGYLFDMLKDIDPQTALYWLKKKNDYLYARDKSWHQSQKDYERFQSLGVYYDPATNPDNEFLKWRYNQ